MGNENVRKRFLRTYFLVVDYKERQCLHKIRDSFMDINDTKIFAFLIVGLNNIYSNIKHQYSYYNVINSGFSKKIKSYLKLSPVLIVEDNIQPVVASKIEKVPRDIRSTYIVRKK